MSKVWCCILIILGLALAVALVVMAIDNHRFVVREYTIPSAKVRESLTFVFVTDLHAKVYGDHNAPLLAAIDRAHPDAVLVGGDMIVSRKARADQTDWMAAAKDFLTNLTRKYPVYMADGNHEGILLAEDAFRPLYEAWCEMARQAGVIKLHNQTVIFYKNHKDTGVCITGLDLDRMTYQKIRPYHLSREAISEKIGGRPNPPDHFHILLAHNPKYFDQYAAWGSDLVLSGHVHGGLLRIGRRGFIGPDLHLFPKYSGGFYLAGKAKGSKASSGSAPGPAMARKAGQLSSPGSGKEKAALQSSAMIVSCGLGSHTLPIRIFNPGELTVVHVKPSE